MTHNFQAAGISSINNLIASIEGGQVTLEAFEEAGRKTIQDMCGKAQEDLRTKLKLFASVTCIKYDLAPTTLDRLVNNIDAFLESCDNNKFFADLSDEIPDWPSSSAGFGEEMTAEWDQRVLEMMRSVVEICQKEMAIIPHCSMGDEIRNSLVLAMVYWLERDISYKSVLFVSNIPNRRYGSSG